MTKTTKIKKKPPIYLLAPELKWETFKRIKDELVKDVGLVPVSVDKVLWEMNRDKLICCWIDQLDEDSMRLGVKVPKNRQIIKITNAESPRNSEKPNLKGKKVAKPDGLYINSVII